MGDDSTIRSLVEEALNSGRGPEEVCREYPELLEEVRSRWLRVRGIAADLEQAFPSSDANGPRHPPRIGCAPAALPEIPGYELEEIIGHGGMGVVYKATHLKLGRTVAVKMLLGGDFAAAKDLDGLLREARTVAGLGHQNIVEVYDAGEVNGLPYFTMELVGGGSLANKLGGVPMPPRDAAQLVETLSAAMQVAHDKGVVHRDLKPGNVLLTPDGTPKISDFGLARGLGGDAPATTSRACVGTPSYMAPEQALGSPDAFDPSVDVYALGAILYETLTGRPPFRADSPVETQRQVISEEPVPPSRINPRVPRDLETMCLKCLQKRAASRYASVADLHEDLRRYLAGEPIAARKTAAVVRALKWARRHPTATTVLVFSMLAAVAASVAAAGSLATAAASRRLVEGALNEAERLQRDSDWVNAKSALLRASLQLGSGGPADLRSRLDSAQKDDDVVRKLEAVRIARALASGSRESMVQSDRDYAALYRDACCATDADSPEESARRIRGSPIRAALIGTMYDWMLCGPLPGHRRDWILAVLRIVDSDGGGWRDRSRDPSVWNDRAAFARVIAESSVPGQPTDYLLWFSYRVREFGSDPTPLLRRVQAAHRDDFWANYVLAEALYARQEMDEAIRFFQAAIAIRPDMALAHNNLANCLRNLNRVGESLDELQEAVRLDASALPIRGNLGMTLTMLGRHSEALPHFEFGVRALPRHVQFRVDLGNALVALDRNREAIEQFEEAARLGGGSDMAREALLTGLVRARHGPKAVAAVQSLIPSGSTRYEAWDSVAEFCLFVGARDEYEATRKRLLETFGTSTDPVVCEKLCRACTLAPISEAERRVASAAIERAFARAESQPSVRIPSLKLALALLKYRSGLAEAAMEIVESDDVSRTMPPLPQLILALALADLHQEPEGVAALGHAATRADNRLVAASSREFWIGRLLRREAESKLLPHLDAFARGEYWPTTQDERLALIATSEDRGMSFASARLFVEAFAKDPGLERDLSTGFRYRAACAAAMCGCGHPTDRPSIPPEEQSLWRARSLSWLREEFAALRNEASPRYRSALLSEWLNDGDLRGIRDPALLAGLPEAERSAFGALWTEVSSVLAHRPY